MSEHEIRSLIRRSRYSREGEQASAFLRLAEHKIRAMERGQGTDDPARRGIEATTRSLRSELRDAVSSFARR